MNAPASSTLSAEHQDFYDRFRSFWADPSGVRVAEIIAPDATIHFSGQGTFTGTEYIEVMQGLLDTMEGVEVKAIDCAGEGEMLYIFWNASAVIDGERRPYHGVDRFRIKDGMAREEHIIFDTALLA